MFLSRYVKGLPFSMKGTRKGFLFMSQNRIQKDKGWTSERSLPVENLFDYPRLLKCLTMWQNVAALNLLEVGQNTFSLSDKKSSNNKTKQNKTRNQ